MADLSPALRRRIFRQRRSRPAGARADHEANGLLDSTAPRRKDLPLLCCALWGYVGRQVDPWVTCLLPDRDGRRREIRIGEIADANGNVSRKALALPVNCGTANRAKMKGQRVAACPQFHRLAALNRTDVPNNELVRTPA